MYKNAFTNICEKLEEMFYYMNLFPKAQDIDY